MRPRLEHRTTRFTTVEQVKGQPCAKGPEHNAKECEKRCEIKDVEQAAAWTFVVSTGRFGGRKGRDSRKS